MGQGSKTSKVTWTWALYMPIPDIVLCTHYWGTSGRILYTHTCRQHVLDVRTCSKGHVHQDDSNPWWSFRGTFMQTGPLLETQMDLQKSDLRIFFRRSWRSRSDLFKSGSICLDDVYHLTLQRQSLQGRSRFTSITLFSVWFLFSHFPVFLAHISLLHAQKSSRHNTRRVFYILH